MLHAAHGILSIRLLTIPYFLRLTACSQKSYSIFRTPRCSLHALKKVTPHSILHATNRILSLKILHIPYSCCSPNNLNKDTPHGRLHAAYRMLSTKIFRCYSTISLIAEMRRSCSWGVWTSVEVVRRTFSMPGNLSLSGMPGSMP